MSSDSIRQNVHTRSAPSLSRLPTLTPLPPPPPPPSPPLTSRISTKLYVTVVEHRSFPTPERERAKSATSCRHSFFLLAINDGMDVPVSLSAQRSSSLQALLLVPLVIDVCCVQCFPVGNHRPAAFLFVVALRALVV